MSDFSFEFGMEYNGKFYYYVAVEYGSTHHRKTIGVAVSNSPPGRLLMRVAMHLLVRHDHRY